MIRNLYQEVQELNSSPAEAFSRGSRLLNICNRVGAIPTRCVGLREYIESIYQFKKEISMVATMEASMENKNELLREIGLLIEISLGEIILMEEKKI